MMQTNPLSWKLRARHVMLYSYYISREQNNMKFLDRAPGGSQGQNSEPGRTGEDWRDRTREKNKHADMPGKDSREDCRTKHSGLRRERQEAQLSLLLENLPHVSPFTFVLFFFQAGNQSLLNY